MKLPIIGQAIGRGGPISARQAVNVWFEARPQGEKAAFVAKPLPKLEKRRTFTDVIVGQQLDDGFTWVIDGLSVYRWLPVDTDIVPSLVGSIAATTAWPRMAHGHGGVLITTGSGVSYYHSANGTSIATRTMPAEVAIDVAYSHGWYLILSQSRLSWVDDPSVNAAALDSTPTEASADKNIAIEPIGAAVAVFGERVIQFYAVTTNPDQPWQPIQEATIPFGVETRAQVKRIGSDIYFWGSQADSSSGLYVLNGMRAQRISTPDIERELLSDSWQDMYAICVDGFECEGRKLVHLHNKITGATWILDVANGVWTQISTNAPYHGVHWFSTARGFLFGVNKVGAYIMRREQAEAGVVRSITTDTVTAGELDKFTLDRLRVDCGGMDQVTLEVSRNGGTAWGAPLSTVVGGKRQVQFNRLGTARQFTFRFSWTGDGVLSNLMPAGA